MENLESRLNKANINKQQLVTALCREKIRPREVSAPYYKYNLTDRITKFLQSKGVYLSEREKSTLAGENLYTAMNKEPLKRTWYGIINSKGIPDEVFNSMTEWENIYFLAGLWNKKATPVESKQYSRPLLENQDVPLIIAETIAAGIYGLRKKHQEEVEKGNYESNIALPYSEEILQRYYSLRSGYVAGRRVAQQQEPASVMPKHLTNRSTLQANEQLFFWSE